MREIKFRGRRITDGSWTYGDLIHSFDLVYVGDEYQFLKENIVVSATIGQYTGLLDKNGKEIYEGDILSCWGGEQCQGYWEFSCLSPINDIREINEFGLYYENIEIVGNIHDTPELLSIPTPREQIPDGGMEG